MIPADIFSLGLILVVLGLVFFLVARLLITPTQRHLPPPIEADFGLRESVAEHKEAVLGIAPGGRVVYTNRTLREMFQVGETEQIDLERLSRRVRPPDSLLILASTETQARFVLDGKLVDAVSYSIVFGSNPFMLIPMRYAQPMGEADGSRVNLSPQTIQTFIDLSRTMAASPDLQTTLEAILESVEKIVPSDTMEVTLWDVESNALVPFRLTGSSGGGRRLEASNQVYDTREGYSGYLFQVRKPLFLPDVEARPDLKPAVSRRILPVRSYIGIPFLIKNEFIGTLELMSLSKDAFHASDLDLLLLLSGQAAIAIHNALIYREEQQRATDLSGLANLTQSLTSIRSETDLFSRLVHSISTLIQVEVLGFLIYDETRHILEGKVPFHGLPPQIVEIYRIPVPPGSIVEQKILEQDVLITENAAQDPFWTTLGFEYLAKAASFRDTALVPLSSAGKMLGYVQASNHKDNTVMFTRDELHMLMVVSNLAASIVESARLERENNQHALRLETLHQIAKISSSKNPIFVIVNQLLQELVKSFKADLAVVFLLDSSSEVLTCYTSCIIGENKVVPDRYLQISRGDNQFNKTVTASQQPVLIQKISEESSLPSFYHQLLKYWQLESVIQAPLVAQGNGLGEVWVASRKYNAFTQADLNTLVSAAGNIAGVVELATLREQTDESLRKRLDQMTTLMRISREFGTSLNIKALLQFVFDEAMSLTRADKGVISFVAPVFGNERLTAEKYRIGDFSAVEIESIEQIGCQSVKPIVISDFQAEGALPPEESLRCGLLVPIVYQQNQVGLISLFSGVENHFDDTLVDLVQSLAAQASLAFINAVQFEETKRRSALLNRVLETLAGLMEVSRSLHTNLPLDRSLTAIASAIADATPFKIVLISLVEPDGKTLRRVCQIGLSSEAWQELQARTQPWHSVQRLMQEDFRIGNCYYIPANRLPIVPADIHSITILAQEANPLPDAWDARDFLLIPLYSSAGAPLGLISVDAPENGRRPDRPTFEALEIFSSQASLMVENHSRIKQLEEKISVLEERAARLEESRRVSQEKLPLFLQKDLDQLVTIHALARQSERFRASLEVAEIANRQSNETAVLQTLGRELVTRFNLDTALIAERNASDIRLIGVIGTIPPGSNPEALFGTRNPLRQLLMDGEILLVPDIQLSADWRTNPMLSALNAQSMIGLPLGIENTRGAGVLVIGQTPLPEFLEEDRWIFMQLVRQVSISLQDLQLLSEIWRRLREVDHLLSFSRRLGSLEPSSILTTLVESVVKIVSNANTAWVALWNSKSRLLSIQAATGYSNNDTLLRLGYHLPIDDTGDLPLPLRVVLYGQPERISEVVFHDEYRLTGADLMEYREATGGLFPASALVVPMRLGENILGVLGLENFESPIAFSTEDEALAFSFAQQAVLALENARLYQAVEQRASRSEALTNIAGILTSSLRFDELEQLLLEKLQSIAPYDTATLWIREGDQLIIRSSRGFSDSDQRIGISLSVYESRLFSEMNEKGRPITVNDVRQDSRFSLVEAPEYLSWLGIPLIAKSSLIGVITLEKREPDFYNDEFVQYAQTFAGQAAISLDNARLFEESRRRAAELNERSQRLALLNQLSSELAASLDIDWILATAAQQMLTALGGAGVSAVLLRVDGRCSYQLEIPSVLQNVPHDLPDIPLFNRLAQTLGIFSTTDVQREEELAPMWESHFLIRKVQSLLVVPMLTLPDLEGWILVESHEERRFSSSEIELARTVCNQTAVAIQKARLFEETRQLTQNLEHRVEERTLQLRREHHNTQSLLHISTELSASLEVSTVLNRTLEVLNDSTGAEESLIFISREGGVVYRAGMDLSGPIQTAERTFRPEEEIARWVTNLRKSAVIEDVITDGRWNLPEESQPAYKSVLAVPLLLGEENLGTLMMFHRFPAFFEENEVRLVEAAARQISIALNNAQLFRLIREQSEQLATMLHVQQVESSRSRAILEAVADGVLVTDANSRITLFNASAESILALSASLVIGQPLDQFSGLFGKVAGSWMKTIQVWSNNPYSYTRSDNYSEQLNLDNGRVVSVHLAPVFLHSEFLGTVSIFRDITHEVQVDRLKSEFVANVSHELRTPLTSIKGYAEVLLMGAVGKMTTQQEQFVQTIKNNTDRLSVLVNDLLDVSQIETGRVMLNIQAVRVDQLAEEVAARFQSRVINAGRNLSIALDIPRNLPMARGDMERVRQVLQNLVNNSYLYTPDGGKVMIRIKNLGAELQVDVEDTGIGISIADQPRIFERFFRGDDPLVLASSGNGLGLAIAKTLVEMHNGKIWFTSCGERGKGSVFSFTLPIYDIKK